MGRIYTTAKIAAGGGVVSPADLPGLKWWYEPDSINLSGSAVTSLTDKSGNGNTVAESGSNRPTVALNALNGFSGVQCVAANSQRLVLANTPLIAAGGSFAFGLVMRVDASSANQMFFCNSVSGTNGIEFFQDGSNYDPLYAGAAFQAANAVSTIGFHVFTYRVSNSASLTGNYRYDGVDTSFTAGTGFITPGAAAGLTLGCRPNLASHSSATFIAGFLCSGHIDPRSIVAAEQYWRNKYAL